MAEDTSSLLRRLDQSDSIPYVTVVWIYGFSWLVMSFVLQIVNLVYYYCSHFFLRLYLFILVPMIM